MGNWFDDPEGVADRMDDRGRREELGLRIRELRKHTGKTIKELAAALRLTEAAVSRYENGHAMPTLENAAAIAKVLGTNLNDLVEGIY